MGCTSKNWYESQIIELDRFKESKLSNYKKLLTWRSCKDFYVATILSGYTFRTEKISPCASFGKFHYLSGTESGDGSGNGKGVGNGYGSGSGRGRGYGKGRGYGRLFKFGDGYGEGIGSGYGEGFGSGDG